MTKKYEGFHFVKDMRREVAGAAPLLVIFLSLVCVFAAGARLLVLG